VEEVNLRNDDTRVTLHHGRHDAVASDVLHVRYHLHRKPQIMDYRDAIPTREVSEDMAPKVRESRAITLLLGEEDKVYYYLGKIG